VKQVIVCTNLRTNPAQPSCAARGGVILADRLEQAIAARGWHVKLTRFCCLGHCETGPNLKLSPGGQFISDIKPDKLDQVLQQIEAFSTDPG
jgi:NADH:ubiquinone oxidoreductase subunit E